MPSQLSVFSPSVICPHLSSLSVFSQIAEQLMTLAYENGINLFDTAEVYAAGKWVLFTDFPSFIAAALSATGIYTYIWGD